MSVSIIQKSSEYQLLLNESIHTGEIFSEVYIINGLTANNSSFINFNSSIPKGVFVNHGIYNNNELTITIENQTSTTYNINTILNIIN